MSLQSLWRYILATYPPATIILTGTYLTTTLFFVLPSLLLTHIVPTFFPAFTVRHKFQPENKQPSSQQIRHSIYIAARNNALVLIPLTVAILAGHQPSILSPTLPSLTTALAQIVTCIFIREAMFYYTHRLLHQPMFYTRIHKFHHQFTAPVGWAAQYAHPVEHIIANILPVVLPPKLVGAHQLVSWAYAGWVMLESTVDHAGYDVPWWGAARRHDGHHERFVGDYGTVGVLDWLHGTRGPVRMSPGGKLEGGDGKKLN